MIEYIDYQKRLTCEEHIVLWLYSQEFIAKENMDYYKDFQITESITEENMDYYKNFQITESLIEEYNAPQNLQRRIQIQKLVENNKEELDSFRENYANRIWDFEKPVLWSDRRKKDYYIKQLNASHRFEVYIDDLFRRHGYDIGLFYGKDQQYHQGETKAGIEIKCDMQLQKTGNVYIEYQERMTKAGEWVDSGILKPDQTKYFLIGTMEEFFILPREKLQNYYHRLVKCGEKMEGIELKEERAHQTSKGFIIQRQTAKQDHISIEEVIDNLKRQ